MIRQFEDLDDILIDQGQSYDYDSKHDNIEDERSDNDENEYTEDFDDASPIKNDRTLGHMQSHVENEDDNYDEDSFVDFKPLSDQRDVSSHHLNKLFPLAEGTDEDVSFNQSASSTPPDNRKKSPIDDQKSAGIAIDRHNTSPQDTSKMASIVQPAVSSEFRAMVAAQTMQNPISTTSTSTSSLPVKRHSLVETIATNAYPSSVKSSFELPAGSRSPKTRSPKASHKMRHTNNNNDSSHDRHNYHSRDNSDRRRSSRYDDDRDSEESSPRNSPQMASQSVSQVVQEVMRQQTELYKAKIVENHFITSSIAAANVLRMTTPGVANSLSLLGLASVGAPVYDPLAALPVDLQHLVRMSPDVQGRVAGLVNLQSDSSIIQQMQQQQQQQQQKQQTDKLSHVEAENTYLREMLARRQRRDDSAVNDLLGLETHLTDEENDKGAVKKKSQQATKKSDKLRPSSSRSVDFTDLPSKNEKTTTHTITRKKTKPVVQPSLTKEESSIAAAAKKVFLSSDISSSSVVAPVTSRPTFLVTQKENPNHHCGDHKAGTAPRVRTSTTVSPLRSSLRDSGEMKTKRAKSPRRGSASPRRTSTVSGDSANDSPSSSSVPADRYSLTVLDPNKNRTYKVMRPSTANQDMVATSNVKPTNKPPPSVRESRDQDSRRPTAEQLRQDAEMDGEEYFKYLIAKNRVTRPDLTAACDHIYSTFLSDMINLCKDRAGADGTSAEEMAMHRVLSGYVASAFAAHKVNGIQANMIRAGLEASTRIRASNKPETKSVENWSKYSVQSGKTKL